MKKTLTTLTLSSIAAVAVANPTTKSEPAPLANININIPTNGAKPLAKIEPTQSSSGVENNSKKKNQELDILPLPSIPAAISESSPKDDQKIKNEIKKENKSEVKLDKNNIKQDIVSEKNGKENPKKEPNITNSASSLPQNNKPEVNKEAKEKNATVHKNLDSNQKSIPSSTLELKKENLQDKNLKEANTLSNSHENTKSSTDLSKNRTAIIGKKVSNETKDVKTEVTLEKKEVINNVQQVNKLPLSTDAPLENKKDALVTNSDINNNNNNIGNISKDSKDIDKQNLSHTSDNSKDTKTNSSTTYKSDNDSLKSIKKKPAPKKVKVIPKYEKTLKTTKTLSQPSLVVDIKRTPDAYVLSNKDINVDVLHNPSTKEFLVKFEHKQGNNFRDSDFANALFTEGKESSMTPLLFTWINSKLDKIEIIKSPVNSNGEYLFQLPQSVGKCEAFYVTYKLVSDTASLTKSIILDANGNPSSEMDRKCKIPQPAAKEDVAYTKNQYLVSTNWQDTNVSVNKPIRFSSLISKEGADITTDSLRYVIVSEDFSKFYYSVGVINKSAILGTVFSQPIHSSGTHFFTAIFNNENGGFELATSKRYINP